MKVDIQDAGPCQKRIKIVIPQETVAQKLEEEYQEMGGLAQIPGFRKGRVPKKVLQKRFGSQIEDKVKGDLMEDALQEALEEHDIVPVGDPSVENAEFDKKEPFEFEITLEVRPEFDLPEYKGIEVTKEVKEVGDEDIDKALEDVFSRTNKLVVVEEGEVKEGDILICEVEVTSGDDTAFAREEIYLYVGEDSIQRFKVDGLKDQLVGKKVEDVVEFEQELDESFPEEKFRGETGRFKITISDIKRNKYESPNDEWASENDYDSLEELREFLSGELEKNFVKQGESDLRDKVLDEVLKRVEFDVPPGMVEKSLHDQLHYDKMMLMMRGTSEEDAEKQIEEKREDLEEQIVRDLRIFFILDKIAKKEKIYVTEDEVAEKLAQLAQQHGRPLKELREEFEENGYIRRIRHQLREQKTVDYLLKKAEVKEA